MGNFHIKSLVLGIGIGIILTAAAGMIFYAGSTAGNPRTTQAAKTSDGPTSVFTSSSSASTATQAASQADNTGDGVKIDRTYIDFSINKGDTSDKVAKRLFELGLVQNEKSFNDKMLENGAEKRLSIGKFKLYKGMSEEDIIKAIINP